MQSQSFSKLRTKVRHDKITPLDIKHNEIAVKELRDLIQSQSTASGDAVCLKPNDRLKDLISAISNWILTNSASENLTLVCNLLLLLMTSLGFDYSF